MNTKEHLIVYVDDEWANRLVFEQAFNPHFRVKALGSGHEALELLRSGESVAAILTDQRMPEMSGHDLLARVKVQSPETVRVVITAYSDLDPILRAVNEGLVHRYVIKPWDRAELEQILLWALEAFALGRESSALQLRLMQTERLVTLGSIGSAMVHDLKQPLTHMNTNVQRLEYFAGSMGALAELLKRAGDALAEGDRENLSDLASELQVIVGDFQRAVTVMTDLTSSFKQFSQPAGRAAAESPAVDPVPVIRYALSVCQETAMRAQGRLIYDGPAELPRVRLGSTEFAQVFINLVANAAQALVRKASRGGRVLVSAAEAGAQVRFTIADDGPGMSPEVLAKVGTPFFSTRPEGTGLGVAQCRRLIERAGGKLDIQSIEGKGTTVSFSLVKA